MSNSSDSSNSSSAGTAGSVGKMADVQHWNSDPGVHFKMVPKYNGQNFAEWKSEIDDVLMALGVTKFVKSELTETDSNYENYLKIGGYMRLTFDFKFKKSIEKYRTPFQIYEYMTKNVKIPISKR